jgi:putative membrane protein
MHKASKILIGFVALEHLLFLVMEMFLWQSDAVIARFGNTPEFAAESAVLAMNQGLYNGFLAAGLIWSLTVREVEHGRSIARFFLGCVIVAGVFGGATAKLSIVFVQALPALLAFATTFLASPGRVAK